MINRKKVVAIYVILSISVFFLNTVNAGGLFASYPISGKITNYKMEPIEGVKIKFEPDGSLFGPVTATTDQLGNYSIAIHKLGDCWVTITKEGYKTYRVRAYIGRDNIWNYKLDPDKYPVSGKIVNRGGEPIEGATISFELDGGRNGVQSVTTDETGNYSTGIIALGDCWVTITKEGYKTFRTRAYVGRENVWNYRLDW